MITYADSPHHPFSELRTLVPSAHLVVWADDPDCGEPPPAYSVGLPPGPVGSTNWLPPGSQGSPHTVITGATAQLVADHLDLAENPESWTRYYSAIRSARGVSDTRRCTGSRDAYWPDDAVCRLPCPTSGAMNRITRTSPPSRSYSDTASTRRP